MLASELGIHDLGLFVLSGLLLNITPGPDSLLIMSRSAGQGWRAGAAAALGIGAGTLVHVVAGALGMSALLAASATAFVVVKLAGAAYLVWLGIQRWREPLALAEPGAEVNRAFYRQGILVNLGNPKAIVFIAALVPQFIDPAAPQWPQFAVIALTMCSLDSAVMSCYALLASRFRGVLSSPRRGLLANRVFGGIFVAAGALLAGTSRQ